MFGDEFLRLRIFLNYSLKIIIVIYSGNNVHSNYIPTLVYKNQMYIHLLRVIWNKNFNVTIVISARII